MQCYRSEQGFALRCTKLLHSSVNKEFLDELVRIPRKDLPKYVLREPPFCATHFEPVQVGKTVALDRDPQTVSYTGHQAGPAGSEEAVKAPCDRSER